MITLLILLLLTIWLLAACLVRAICAMEYADFLDQYYNV